MKQRVIFVCTGNSCRSQMAEGWLRHLYGDKYDVYSAGTHPSYLNENAATVMKEQGVDISGGIPESIDKYADQKFDVVVTVCDSAKESCPVFTNADKIYHWPFFDPYLAEGTGTEEEVLNVFRDVRDKIRKKLEDELG